MRRSFKGLGTEIELCIWPEPGRERLAAATLARAVRFIRQAERRLSRFDRSSELSRLNRRAGTSLRVSALTFAVVRAAIDAARATAGLFDPTVLRPLLQAGYDRSFDQLQRQVEQNHAPMSNGGPVLGQWQAIWLDHARRTVCLPAGTGIDLGGIAKGWLADRVLQGLQRAGAACVDLGGDIALSIPRAGTDDWQIEIAQPHAGRQVAGIVQLPGGGVATSGITRRAWTAGSETRHHLIDPRTGRPAATDLLSVTVAAPTATAAEVAAKAVLLLGSEAGSRALALSDNLAGVLIPAQGTPIVIGTRNGHELFLERSA